MKFKGLDKFQVRDIGCNTMTEKDDYFKKLRSFISYQPKLMEWVVWLTGLGFCGGLISALLTGSNIWPLSGIFIGICFFFYSLISGLILGFFSANILIRSVFSLVVVSLFFIVYIKKSHILNPWRNVLDAKIATCTSVEDEINKIASELLDEDKIFTNQLLKIAKHERGIFLNLDVYREKLIYKQGHNWSFVSPDPWVSKSYKRRFYFRNKTDCTGLPEGQRLKLVVGLVMACHAYFGECKIDIDGLNTYFGHLTEPNRDILKIIKKLQE